MVQDRGASAARGAIYERENLHLVMIAAALHFRAGLTADERFVALHNAALAAERGKVAGAHGFADTVRQEPRRLVLDFQNAVELVGGNALLAGHDYPR